MIQAMTTRSPGPDAGRQTLEAFAAGLRYPALWPGDADYAEATRIWND